MLVVQYILAYGRRDVTCDRGLMGDTTQSWVCYVVEFRSFSCVALGGKRACKRQIGQQANNSECLAILTASTSVPAPFAFWFSVVYSGVGSDGSKCGLVV